MMAMFSTVDLESVEREVEDSKQAVLRLLSNEERAEDRFEEIAGISDQAERLEEAAKLIVECEALVSYAKQMEAEMKRAKNRMTEMADKVKAGIHDEVEDAGGEFTTKNWKMKIRQNPAKVIVDDLSVVAKKYRKEPDPIPPVEEWPVDKNLVKTALTKERVQSIDGVHLEQGSRVEVKPR
jgi:hypothetical protein